MDDDVIMHHDAQDLTGLLQLARHVVVILARSQIARGMVVTDDDGIGFR